LLEIDARKVCFLCVAALIGVYMLGLRKMRHLVLILLVPLALSAQAPAPGRAASPRGGNSGTQPPPPPPTPAADLASMEGQVFNAIGGTPLRKATININRQNSGPMAPGARSSYSATTDASGHYSIAGIEPGTYRVNADRTGFLNMAYNARRPGGPGTPLDLARAQKMTGVDFRLTPHGVLSGKITDEDGDPVEGVQIQILRLVYNQGRKQLQGNGGESTNDLGEYRISGIVPGKYYLSAIYRNRRLTMAGMQEDNSAQEDYVTTFFPGVTDVAAASPIEMAPGDQLQGINLRLSKVHTVRVAGHLVDNTSPPPPPSDGGRGTVTNIVNGQVVNAVNMPVNGRIQLRLQPRSSLGPNGMNVNTPVRADGNFEFPSVPPGSYYLIAINNQAGRNGAHATRQPLDVGDSNIEGVNVAINPGADVSGHVRYDGDPPQPLPSLTVRLTPREMNMGIPPPPPARVEDDGSFHFSDISLDQYTVNVNTPAGLYLKSVRSGNTDVMVSGLDLSSGAGALDILMGLNPPVVGGTVVNAEAGQPAAAVTVVLTPREKERQGQSYFYSTTNTDQYGNFTFQRVTPGDYQVYAWEDVPYGQWFDPEFMKAYEGKGETLTAKEGSPVNVKLTMIPAK
jgi:protocatechuate 3,4-dioxygenase beta subunit